MGRPEGQIVVGDSSGGITVYGSNFRPLKKMHVGSGSVVEALAAGKGILGAVYGESGENNVGLLAVLTDQGDRVWQAAWSSSGLYPPLPPQPFAVVGNNVVVLEPKGDGHSLKLTSRKLSDGQVNWVSNAGFFSGPPVVCGNTVYIEDVDQIRKFDAQTGVELTQSQ